MNEFDDNEIRDALRRRTGGPTEGFGLEAAHSAVIARAGRVRRRRAAAAGGAAMAGLIGAAVFVIGPGADSVVRNPADRTDESVAAPDDTSVVASSVPTAPDQTDRDQNAAGTTPPTTTSLSPATTAPANRPPIATTPSTTAPAPPATTAGNLPAPPETTSPEPTPPTTATAPSTTIAASPDPFVRTYASAGGSITVRWDGAALSLQQVSAAPGFDDEVEEDRADRIRVRFDGDDDEFRIEIRFEDGEIVRIE